jgi:hypothetical protein
MRLRLQILGRQKMPLMRSKMDLKERNQMNYKCTSKGCTGVFPEIGICYDDETYIRKCDLCGRWLVDINYSYYEVSGIVNNAENAVEIARTKHQGWKDGWGKTSVFNLMKMEVAQ